MTFKERRKRADVQKIADDFDRIESSFISYTQKLNKKRQAQIVKRIERVIPELIEAYENDDSEEVEGILKSLKMPSSREWRKGIHRLVLTSTESGILRAHFEMLRLKDLYEFDESWTPQVINEGYDYGVVLPEEARKYIRKHAYEVGVITEETVLNRLRKELENGLDEGLPPKEMTKRVRETAGTWMSDWHAQTIARTETGKFYNAGRLARWLDPEANGFVEALQYDAIIDSRTTEVCRHLDGKIISIQDQATIQEYTPPNHYQCRATWIPVTKYEEWEPDFDTQLTPQKGFDFKSPLPKLLQGKTEPLVQPKKKIDPSKITDPDMIRTLDDEDFKVAIRNITDTTLKLGMIKERAEEMAVRDNGLKETTGSFNFDGIYKGTKANSSYFIANGQFYDFYDDGSLDWEELNDKLSKADSKKEIDKIIADFRKKHGDNFRYAELIRQLEEAFKKIPVTMTWDGLKPVQGRSEEAKKLFQIKEPPKTANYKNATGLQQALKDGQSWINKYMDDKLAPKTGVKMRFSKDNLRAYAIGAKGTIHFGPYERNAGVIVHETAHVIHWNNEEIAKLVNEFFMQRTDNLKLDWTKRYGEDVIPDDFYNSYVGRIYGWEKQYEKQTGLPFYGQEVLSMGMQAMYEDPVKFYQDDKDHFLFTYAILRGLF